MASSNICVPKRIASIHSGSSLNFDWDLFFRRVAEKNEIKARAEDEQHRSLKSRWDLFLKKEDLIKNKRIQEHSYRSASTMYHQMKNTAQIVEQHRGVREPADTDVQKQITRESTILQRKKEAKRRTALEAMKITEQRRLREKINDQIQPILFHEKQAIDTKPVQQMVNNSKTPKQIYSLKDARISTDFKNNSDYNPHISQKCKQSEKDKLQRTKLSKLARIQECIKEMETQKAIEKSKTELCRNEISNQYVDGASRDQEAKHRKARAIRNFFEEQQMKKGDIPRDQEIEDGNVSIKNLKLPTPLELGATIPCKDKPEQLSAEPDALESSKSYASEEKKSSLSIVTKKNCHKIIYSIDELKYLNPNRFITEKLWRRF